MINSKKCSKCKKVKSFDQFYKNVQGKHGLHSSCKLCQKISNEAWANSHHEQKCATAKAWKSNNKTRIRDQAKARRWRNVEKSRENERKKSVKAKHGITFEEKELMFYKQGRVCAVCSSPTPGTIKGWHIDHCHKTEKIRGILCHPCNATLGNAKDSIGRLQKLIEYLRKHGG